MDDAKENAATDAPDQIPAWVIVDQITRQCKHDGTPVSKDLAEFLVQSIISDPEANFLNPGNVFCRANLPLLVEACTEKLKNQPFVIGAADLQIFLDNEFPTRDTVLSNLKRELDAANHMLLDDILTSVVNTTWDLEQLNKKIIAYIVKRSGLGDAMDQNVLKDCAAALSSVWPEGTLNKFAYLPRDRKEIELHDYLLLTSGVRLFNKEKQQGGVGIRDVASSLNTNLANLRTHSAAELERIQTERSTLTDVVAGVLQGILPEYFAIEETLKDTLIFLHQYTANLNILKNEISESAIVAERALISFRARVRDLQENCRNERVIAANIVFPLFVSLAKDWAVLEDEYKRVILLENVFHETQRKLEEWVKLKETLTECFSKLRHLQQPPSTAIQQNRLPATKTIRLLQRDTTAQYDQIPIALKGACIVTLVEDSGFFAMGNKNIGIIQYESYYLNFRSADAAVKFCKDPARYFTDLDSCLNKRPVLKKLLGLSVRKNSADGTEELARQSRCGVVKVDAGVQPDLHPISHHYDPNYDWNVWNIRKKAYKLYNITQSKTHSTQTYLSRYRKEVASQSVMAPKNVEVQTKTESYTTGVRHLQFFGGIRGGPDAFNKIRFKQIDLSSDKQEKE